MSTETDRRGGRGSGPERLGLTVLAALLGAAAVIATFGPTPLAFWHGVLSPSATGWMLAGPLGPDPVQYWLGWTWFRRDAWRWPPGLNPGYGLELSSAIFYADIVPLLAFLFKLLRDVWTVEQYWGIWILACGMLHGAFALQLVSLAGIGRGAAAQVALLAATGLLVLQPMMLNRLGGHLALGAQWTVLAALLLCLTAGGRLGRPLAWASLVLATSLIHAYLLVMVVVLWGADWTRRVLDRPSAAHAAEAAAVPGLCLAGLWAAGFFVLRTGFDAPGYGELGFNLLSWIDATEWGSLLPPVPDLRHGEAGGAYLGLGALGLIAAALVLVLLGRARWLRPALGRRWPLLLALLCMGAFAVTHRPVLAGRQVTLVALPEWLEALAATLRASERFAWPLAYALLAASAIVVLRAASRRHAVSAAALLVSLLVLQVVDLWPPMQRLEALVIKTPRVQPERLPDPFWETLGAHAVRVRAVPAADRGLHWEPVARFAARHGLETDAVYLARIDPARVAALGEAITARLATGAHEERTLYVLRDRETLERAEAGRDAEADPLLLIDGLVVLVPGWGRREIPPHLPVLSAPFDALPDGAIADRLR